jgi:hypothetical protein
MASHRALIKVIRRFLWALNSHFLHNYASAIHYELNKSSCSNIFASGFYILSCTCSFLQFPIDSIIYNSFLFMLPHGSASSSYIYENIVIENIFLGSKSPFLHRNNNFPLTILPKKILCIGG